ncbi:MAG: nascent polypeptide-associated complex protein, partial [Candidatus Subteraquimicrobiales bacterium]|nr:nascent polypeptide-associated complex protein [Candidatus Subteraquimicrobiales bacterium]
MMPGMNPKKMKQMMRQLGMQMDPIEDVEEIVIQTKKGRYVFPSAEVVMMKVQGVITYQVTGEPEFIEAEPGIPEEDIAMVAEQTGVSSTAAKEA